MSKTPPNLANLPPDVQAFVAAQAAELARKDAEMLGLSLSHANAQKRLKDEKASAETALAAERAEHARPAEAARQQQGDIGAHHRAGDVERHARGDAEEESAGGD